LQVSGPWGTGVRKELLSALKEKLMGNHYRRVMGLTLVAFLCSLVPFDRGTKCMLFGYLLMHAIPIKLLAYHLHYNKVPSNGVFPSLSDWELPINVFLTPRNCQLIGILFLARACIHRLALGSSAKTPVIH